MNQFFTYSLIGLGVGLIIFPIGLGIFVLFRNTFERRKIKRMLKKGHFLITIDPRDYDYKSWENQRYGNIDRNKYKDDLERLNEKIFKTGIIKSNPDNFMIKIKEYVNKMREMNYTDDKIKEEFIKRKYPQELINQIFNENGR